MYAVKHVINIGRGDWVFIEPLGDLHIGCEGFDHERFQERITAIKKDKNRYWIGMGDMVENIRPYKRGAIDKRWNLNVLRGEPNWETQKELLIQYLKPINNKCLGLLWGNHEWTSMEEQEFINTVANPLGVRFLGALGFIILDIRSGGKKLGEWVIFATHGSYAGYRLGGALNRLQDLARIYVADIYLMGHTHAKSIQQDIRITVEFDKNGRPHVVERPVMYALTGTFHNPYILNTTMYSDMRPVPRSIRKGTITISIDPWTGKLHGYD